MRTTHIYKDAAKACPKCHKIMKSAVVKGKNVWICVKCGIKSEAGNFRKERENERNII